MLNRLTSLLAQNSSNAWQLKDFAGIDQLHLGGIAATQELIAWLPAAAKQGLDIGCGLGGTSRYLAQQHGCSMTGLDLNAEYIQAATLLNQNVATPPDCSFVVGNSLSLPFAAASFDFIVSQHATMNIAPKAELLAGLYDVIKPRGYLLLHEVMLATGVEAAAVSYPTPWAQVFNDSHLIPWQEFVHMANSSGFRLQKFADNTATALAWIKQARQHKPLSAFSSPFTAQLALGAKAGVMSANVLANIQQGRLQVVSALLIKD